jgi:hypothetical protein
VSFCGRSEGNKAEGRSTAGSPPPPLFHKGLEGRGFSVSIHSKALSLELRENQDDAAVFTWLRYQKLHEKARGKYAQWEITISDVLDKQNPAEVQGAVVVVVPGISGKLKL